MKSYSDVCHEYVRLFEKKHEYEFTGFVGDTCQIASFIDEYFFNIADIVHDIDNEIKADLIFQWHRECLENEHKKINFRSYAMGLRFEQVPLKVYISGAISGLDFADVCAQFYGAAAQIKAKGDKPVNPIDILNAGKDVSWTAYMEEDINELSKCDAICLLKGWEKSKGARI
jgi:hypothetical protein